MGREATTDFPWRRGTASVFGAIVSPGYPAITGSQRQYDGGKRCEIFDTG
ncbi:MAG: hypothetical protein ACXW4N_09295 [Candidatus Deferrimicrobiaceae bacterium]